MNTKPTVGSITYDKRSAPEGWPAHMGVFSGRCSFGPFNEPSVVLSLDDQRILIQTSEQLDAAIEILRLCQTEMNVNSGWDES